MRSVIMTSLIIVLLFTGCKPSADDTNNDERAFYAYEQFAMGADLSYVNQILDHGGIYRDSGAIQDPYIIFRKYGANAIRFRLWHNPAWTRTVYNPPLTDMYNDFSDVKRGIIAAKGQGMAVCLDFHYSDSWADPSKQVVPETWESLSLPDLHDSIYNYTFNTLQKLGAVNLMPEYVQAGNEINPGFLLPQGNRWNGNEANMIYLLNSAIKAIRDAGASNPVKPKIIIHIAQPENVDIWFNGLAAKGLTDYDIIGISYYYIWSTTGLENLKNSISAIKSKYSKEVMILETAYPWTKVNADSYNNIISIDKILSAYPATPEGQLEYLKTLTQQIIDGGGKGIFYWEPAWITSDMKDPWGTGSSWDCNTLFDFKGNVNRGMDYMTWKYTGISR